MFKTDLKLNGFKSSLVLIRYRISHWMYQHAGGTVYICDLFFRIIFWILGINCQISYKCSIGRNIRLLHGADGVIISKYAVIGDRVTIYHQVTIGINEGTERKYVSIGNDCFIGAGAKVINCSVGDHCKIGANAVAYKDIPNDTIVVSIQTMTTQKAEIRKDGENEKIEHKIKE